MKYIISESRVVKLVAEYIKMEYGDMEQVYDKDKRIVFWFKKGDEKKFPYFEINDSGTLWVPDDLKYNIGNLFGFEYDRQINNVIMDVWETIYGIKPERVNIYFNI